MWSELCYHRGAQNWNEALPLGNGRLGAMLRGDPAHETVWLNEDSLWSGHPIRYDCDNAPEWYARAQALVREGRLTEAQAILEQHHTGSPTQCYLPLAQLELTFEGEDGEGTRMLDLSTGLHTVSGRHCVRECFVSYPDQVMAMEISGCEPGSVCFTLQLVPALDATVTLREDRISIRGNAPVVDYVYGKPQHEAGTVRYGEKDEDKGMGYYAEVRLTLRGGRAERRGGGIMVSGADSAVLLFDARTSFNGWNRHPVLEGRPFVEPCTANLDRAQTMSYSHLRERHLADHTALFRRTALNIRHEGDRTLMTTDGLLEDHQSPDRGRQIDLYELYFAFGRYLTIAGSREGTHAMNLQGIWNDHLTPPWCGNYTVNINTQMNYWPTLAANLAECQLPLVQLVTELCESGKHTAQSYYGAPGSVAHHNTDIWRLSSPVGCRYPDSAMWACWNMSLPWLSSQLWERWQYTGDREYLRSVVWPVLRECCHFYMSQLE